MVDAFVAALDAALAEQTDPADLAHWGDWLVMAATLALLRSRLLLPPDAPDARTARDEAEAMRHQLLERAAMRQAAAWLDHRTQLGRDVFGRAGTVEMARPGRAADITDLLRACLVALRVPEQADTYRLQFVELWRVPDAMARIRQMLASRPDGGALGSFLPAMDKAKADRELRCRAAVACTFLGGLELVREGHVTMRQDDAWLNVRIARMVDPAA